MYSKKEIEALPTMSVGQEADLKIDTGKMRVWLSRCTVADGMPYNNQVTVEKLKDGRWLTLEEYEAE